MKDSCEASCPAGLAEMNTANKSSLGASTNLFWPYSDDETTRISSSDPL